MTVSEIITLKHARKLTMLTAYDYPLAKLIDNAGIDIILIGDSLANVVLGLESTKDVGMSEMIHHAKAVARAVKHALLIADMPYNAYQTNPHEALNNAQRFIKEADCNAVKLEWFDQCIEVSRQIISAGIPVMGHIGLTPQTADKIGGFKVQGKSAKDAKRLIEQARSLEQIGCFSILLECVPDKIAEMITLQSKIPVIGIGAGSYCNGQVLVIHDVLGLFDRYKPKFVKQYINLSEIIHNAVCQYKHEVISGTFPDKEHSFTIKDEELDKLRNEEKGDH